MALSARLNLRQGQSLVMTPKLQQAIKLLQLSNLELSEFVEQTLQNNPLLELEDTGVYQCSTNTPQDRRSEATNKIRLEENPNINIAPEEFVKADIFDLTGITENYGAKLNSKELIEKTSNQSSVDTFSATENSLSQR
jgi:RNA polymerase sigma-54 factor